MQDNRQYFALFETELFNSCEVDETGRGSKINLNSSIIIQIKVVALRKLRSSRADHNM